ncbi:uncharacterized protein [Rutidosis leptorrhynchoides]|uniref:uncharacterized protein n=1 Tax=Rutidosis leptorrhynchoides TaxID=125765 RepID=UPI003A9A5149
MDLETENRIAAILMKEAAELRRQADRDGVDAYLKPPNVRGRPNSRFLTATVRGVQQANRVVEINEMWRVRQKEKELDDRVKKNDSRNISHNSISCLQKNTNTNRFDDCEWSSSFLCSSSKRRSEDDGLRDQEIEEFLHSRVKRGRGAVGSRMDETGPYPGCKDKREASPDEGYRESRDKRVILGPEKPLNLKSCSSDDDDDDDDDESYKKREKRSERNGSSKWSRRKHGSEEKSRNIKKEKREKKRSKRHH